MAQRLTTRPTRRWAPRAQSAALEADATDVPSGLATRCMRLLDVAAAAVVLLDPIHDQGRLSLVAASCARSLLLERFAVSIDAGPCIEAARTGAQVCSPHIDLDTDLWPGFTRAARIIGFRAAHALPIRCRGEVVGALTLLHTAPRTLCAPARDRGQVLADAAGLTLGADRARRRSAATVVRPVCDVLADPARSPGRSPGGTR